MTIKSIIKSFDFHGAPVSLTYKGGATHKSFTGGIITILSRLGILAFFLSMINDVINKTKSVTMKEVFMSPNFSN